MVEKILIVDNDKGLGEEMAEMFKACGYAVDNEFDGLAREKAIRENKYDIFILDYKTVNAE